MAPCGSRRSCASSPAKCAAADRSCSPERLRVGWRTRAYCPRRTSWISVNPLGRGRSSLTTWGVVRPCSRHYRQCQPGVPPIALLRASRGSRRAGTAAGARSAARSGRGGVLASWRWKGPPARPTVSKFQHLRLHPERLEPAAEHGFGVVPGRQLFRRRLRLADPSR